ncbi:MAG: hypothetical protein A3I02_12030, partial [Betaproteobacteria bacterium RIFCSPLOWO2_02_FULL_67_26]
MPVHRRSRRFAPKPLALALARIGFVSLLAAPLPYAAAQQLPSGGTVAHGAATIQNLSATRQRITQSSDKAIINWQGFSIGASSSVQFVQPGASSVVLNRVTGNNPSAIFGSLSANGQVFLVNPRGIYFSPTASIDVAGLVASTLNIRDSDFLAGRYTFSREPGAPGHASVINEGRITARPGGYVVLAGDYAANRGVIEAQGGSVALASGSRVTLDFHGDGLINLAVNEKALSDLAGVANAGELIAEGGRVVMTAAVARDLAGTVVNNTGVVRATGTVQKDGAIYLVGDGGDVTAGGRLDASGPRGGNLTVQAKAGTTLVSGQVDASGAEGRGGTVQLLGERVGLIANASVNASGTSGGGTVLVGGDYQGKNPGIQNAQRAYVGPDATIAADSTQAGDGGKVIVWADGDTRYFGSISARGGAQSGNGGFVETSGKNVLDIVGARVDAGAPNGTPGSWLLDPRNVTLVNATAGGAFGGGSPDIFTPTADDATVDVATINATLGGGTSVTITTGSTGTQAGNITVAAPVSKTAGADATLTLTAANDILINDTITSTSGALGVVLDATGSINLAAAITSNNGDIALQAAGTGGIALGANLAAGTGTVRLVSGGAISQTAGAITATALGINTTAAGAVTLNQAGNAVGTLAANLAGAGSALQFTNSAALAVGSVAAAGAFANTVGITTNDGALTLTATDVNIGQAVSVGTGDVTLRPVAAAATIGIADASKSFNLTDTDLGNITSTGLITVGANTNTGGITIGTDGALAQGAKNFSFVTAGDIAIGPNSFTTGGNVTLTADADANGTGAITTGAGAVGANLLQATAAQGIALNTSVDTLTAVNSTSGGVTIDETNAITLGSGGVGLASGTGNGDITVRSGSDMTLTQNINPGTGIVRLNSTGGGITQGVGGGRIFGSALGVRSFTSATFRTETGVPHNDVDTIAADTGAGSLTYMDLPGVGPNTLTIGTVSAVVTLFPAVSGLNATSGNISVTADGNLIVNQPVTTTTGVITLATSEITSADAILTLNANLTTNNTASPRVVLNSADSINQTGGVITTPRLAVRAAGGPNDDSVLLTGANAVGMVAAEKLNPLDGSTGGIQDFTLNNGSNDLTVGTVDGITGVTATPGDPATDTPGLPADFGRVTLTSGSIAATSPISTGAVDQGAVTLQPQAGTAVNFGTAAGYGLTQANLDQITTGSLRVGRTDGGALAVNGAITPPAGWNTLILRAGAGGISQSVPLTLGAAGSLGVESTGAVTLTDAGNTLGTFAAALTGTGALRFNSSTAFTVGLVGAIPGTPPISVPTFTLTGINTSAATNRDATLTGAGQITLDADVNAGIGTGTVAFSTTAGGVSQNSGAITADKLLLLGTGNFGLAQTANRAGTLAANVTGGVSYSEADAVIVGSVAHPAGLAGGPTTGITTGGSNVTLAVDGLTISNAINAGTAGVTLTTATPARQITLGTGGAAPHLQLTDATLDLVTAGALTIGDPAHSGAILVQGGGPIDPANVSAGGQLTLQNTTGGITINDVLGATNRPVVLTSAAAITDSGGTTGVRATSLATTSAGGMSLTGSGNQVTTFNAIETGAGSVTLTNNSAGLTINGIQTTTVPFQTMQDAVVSNTGDITVQAPINTQNIGDPGAMPVVPPTPNATSNISLTSTTGSIAVNQSLTAGSGGTVTLSAGGSGAPCAAGVSVCQGSGQITGTNLRLTGTAANGAFTLDSATNDVGTIAASVQGPLTYRDASSITVGSVGGTNGITTSSDVVVLTAGGAGTIAVNQAVNSGTATTTLTAAGLTQTAAITAGGLLVGDTNTATSGTYTLTNAGNNVGSLSADIFGSFSYRDADGFSVAPVAGSATGINTRGDIFTGALTLNGGGTISLLSNVSAGGNTMTISTTAGGVNQTGGGVSAFSLNLTGTGTFSLNQTASNDLTVLGANVTGPFSYGDKNALIVTTTGVASGNNDISLTATRLSVLGHVNAGTANVTLTTLETAASNDDIVLNAAGNVITGTTVRLVSADSISHIAGTINATNLFTQAEGSNNVVSTATGEVWYDVAGETTFNRTVVADRVVIWSSTGNPTVNQTGGSITTSELMFMGFIGSPVFNFNQNNSASTIAGTGDATASILNGSPSVNYTNTGALSVGFVTTTNGPGGFVPASAVGFDTNGGNVRLVTGGALSLNERLNAGAGAAQFVVASGGITQSAFAPITAGFLLIGSGGANAAVNLATATNNVTVIGDFAGNGVSVAGPSFTFRDADDVSVTGPVSVANAGPASVDIRSSAGTVSVSNNGVTTFGSIAATSTGNVAPATVNLTGSTGVSVAGTITATGGGTGSGVNAGVTLETLNAGSFGGPVTVTGSVTATDNGGATPTAAAPHSAQITVRARDQFCGFGPPCGTANVRNLTATSSNGRAVVDVFSQRGLTVSGPLAATGQTRPLVKLDTLVKDSSNNVVSSANIATSGTITTVSTSETSVNTLPNDVTGGVSVTGGNTVTIGAKVESRHQDPALRAQDGIAIDTRANINVNAGIATTSGGGIGITTGGNGTVSGNGLIEAQSVNFLAPKNQATYNVKTRIEAPGGGGGGNLNALGGRSMTIDNSAASASSILIAALGFIDATANPAVDLPIGDLSVIHPGTLQIATLNNTNPGNIFSNPVSDLTLVANDFITIPGAITTMAATRATIRPFSNTRNIQVSNTGTSDGFNLVLTTQLTGTVGTGLLQQFHRDASLVIGGPDHKGDVSVGLGGLFTLGNMDLTFQTGSNGRVIRNFFSVSPDGGGTANSPLGPEPKVPFPQLGYPGSDYAPPEAESVSGIGRITSNRVHLIENNTFQPTPGVTIVGSCATPCPGGSAGGAAPVNPGTGTGGSGGG